MKNNRRDNAKKKAETIYRFLFTLLKLRQEGLPLFTSFFCFGNYVNSAFSLEITIVIIKYYLANKGFFCENNPKSMYLQDQVRT